MTGSVLERHTPGWAIALGVILFPIGLLFLFAKADRPRIVYTTDLTASTGA
jgi:hypothetical protein